MRAPLQVLTGIALLLLVAALPASAQAPIYQCRVVAEFPHDPGTSTQGLFFFDGNLYESSGGYGESFLAIADLNTGEYIRRIPLQGKYFAEGITPYEDKLYMLTWLSGTGFIHSLKTIEQLSSFAYRQSGDDTEGWGLTFGNDRFIMSTGQDSLQFHRPKDFMLTTTVRVRDGNKRIRLLNELEYVGGMVLANVWKSDTICVIDPANGFVRAWIDLTSLRDIIAPSSGVANGIAYDQETGALFVTGKNWDKLFQIEIDEILWRQPVSFEKVSVSAE